MSHSFLGDVAAIDISKIAHGKHSILASDEMKSAVVQSNRNVYEAINSKDPSVEDMYRTIPPHFLLSTSTTLPIPVNIDKLLAKAPRGYCVRSRSGPAHYDAEIQTDPYDASVDEVEKLRSVLVMLHNQVTAQSHELARLRHAAHNSVSRHYLDSACALTPSHSSVDAAVSVARETLAQALMLRVSRREVLDMLRSKADKGTIAAAIEKMEHLQKIAQAAAQALAQEREERLEAARKAAESRMDAVSRAQQALKEAEERRKRRERDKDAAILALGEDSDSSEEDLPLPPVTPAFTPPPPPPPPMPKSPTLPLASTITVKSSLKPFSASMGPGNSDEPLLKRIKRLEDALAVWEAAAHGGDLLAAIERAIDTASNRSLAQQLRDTIDNCLAESERLRAHAELVTAHLAEQEKTLNNTTISQLLKRMDGLEHSSEGDEGGLRGAYARLAKQHRDTAEQMRQIKEMLAASVRSKAARPLTAGSSPSVTAATPVIVNSPLSGTAWRSRRGARGKRGSDGAIGATMQANEMLMSDSHVQTQDKLQEMTRVLLALQSKQESHTKNLNTTIKDLDKAIAVLSDTLHQAHIGVKTGYIHTETEKALLKRAAAIEGGIAGVVNQSLNMNATSFANSQRGSSQLPSQLSRPGSSRLMNDTYPPPYSLTQPLPRAATAAATSRRVADPHKLQTGFSGFSYQKTDVREHPYVDSGAYASRMGTRRVDRERSGGFGSSYGRVYGDTTRSQSGLGGGGGGGNDFDEK